MNASQALLSVSDKRGLIDFARGLHELGIRLLSTGGTARALTDAGLPVTEVGQYTGFAEMLDGRVKTLHPKIHGGILARRDLPEHMQAIAEHGIERIDLVVVNLYPFVQTIARADCTFAEAIENIDIGGPSMVRAAAKNHGDDAGGVGIVTDPDDYPALLAELQQNHGALSTATRRALAAKAFTHTARYDAAIANYLTGPAHAQQPSDFPAALQLAFDKAEELRYGENPHQRAAFYRDANACAGGIARAEQLQGKALSYNNLADADAAWNAVCAFAPQTPACVIVKHANPCGAALAASAEAAYRRAFATDPTSSFGGIIAFNTRVDAEAARAVSAQFLEVLVAPEYSDEALSVLAAKPNVRVLRAQPLQTGGQRDYKRIGGGLLVQDSDDLPLDEAALRCVTKRQPTEAERADLLFAWRIAQYVKSNAIVYCREQATVGIGAGQMSRVDSARIAVIKAGHAGLDVAGSVVASDAFFPFRDGLDVLAQAGARAVIQPGGSVRDEEVIQAANEHDIAMLFTGARHFRH